MCAFCHTDETLKDKNYYGLREDSINVQNCNLINTSFAKTNFQNGVFRNNHWSAMSTLWNASYRNIDFKDEQFLKCVLSEAALESVRFQNVEMQDCGFLGAFWKSGGITNGKYVNVNFRNTSLYHITIVNASFSDCDFSKTSFGEINDGSFKDCNFSEAYLQLFQYVKLHVCKFSDCNAEQGHAAFRWCELEQCTFENIQMAEMRGCTIKNCTFENQLGFAEDFYLLYSTVEDCTFDGKMTATMTQKMLVLTLAGTFTDCTMKDVILSKGSLQKTTFKNVTFTNCQLAKNRLSDCTFIDCTFSQVDFGQYEILNCTFQNVNFQDCTLKYSSFVNTTINDLKMLRGELSNFDFHSDILKSIGEFKGVNMKSCDFSNLKLEDWSFKECILKGTNFSNCMMKNIDFTNAQLGSDATEKISAANLSSCIFEKVTFSGANLYGTIFGNSATADGALDDTVSFQNAQAQDADFGNVIFQKADFSAVSALGADLSNSLFLECNFNKGSFGANDRGIQGNFAASMLLSCTFTEAMLQGTNFVDSMVCKSVGFLFHLPATLLEELKNDKDLKKENVVSALQQQGMKLEHSITIEPVTTMSQCSWLIKEKDVIEEIEWVCGYIDAQVEGSIAVYRTRGIYVFEIKEDISHVLNQEVMTEELRKQFLNNGLKLPSKTNLQMLEQNKYWRVHCHQVEDNGFSGYALIKAQNRDVIQVYGCTLIYLWKTTTKGERKAYSSAFNTTGILPTSFDTKTICPNGENYKAVTDSEAWKTYLTAKKITWLG